MCYYNNIKIAFWEGTMSTTIKYSTFEKGRLFPRSSPDGKGPDIELKLLFSSVSKYSNDWISTPHTHQFTELLFVTEGQGFFLSNNLHIRNPIERGSLLIVNPSVLHTEISKPEKPLNYYTLGFYGMNFNIDENCTILRVYENYNEFYQYFLTIFDNGDRSSPFAEELTYNAFINLIIRIIELSNSSYIPQPEKTLSPGLEKVLEYIDENYFQPLTLDELTEVGLMSKAQLIRLFNRHFGMPPIDYVLKKRIAIAKQLLQNTEDSVTQIAASVGFNSASNFINKFKKLEHMTPTQYAESKKR